MDEKRQAFETRMIYCSTLGARFSPYLAQTLEVTLPCLRFYSHGRVREPCAVYVPRRFFQLFLTNVFSAQHSLFLPQTKQHDHKPNGPLLLINCNSSEHDPTFLASSTNVFPNPYAWSAGLKHSRSNSTKKSWRQRNGSYSPFLISERYVPQDWHHMQMVLIVMRWYWWKR